MNHSIGGEWKKKKEEEMQGGSSGGNETRFQQYTNTSSGPGNIIILNQTQSE